MASEKDLSPAQLQQLKDNLHARREELTELLLQREQTAKPVILDQNSVGRVSRIDAIQQQKMAEANKFQAQQELKKITSALQQLHDEDYGDCLTCGEAIGFPRLQVKPTATLCIACQQLQENG